MYDVELIVHIPEIPHPRMSHTGPLRNLDDH